MSALSLLFLRALKRLRWEIAIRFGLFSDTHLINNKIIRKNQLGQRVLINLGCGTRYHPDWVNIDFRGNGETVASWDLRKPLPFADQSCDAIYASHVIEHFTRTDARSLLLECRRLLKPGGCLRLVAPDLEGIVRAYIEALDSVRNNELNAVARHEWMSIELLDQLVRHVSGGEMMKYWAQKVVPEEGFVAERVGLEYINARTYAKDFAPNVDSRKSALDVGKFRLGGEAHLWMYDECSLSRLLIECGYSNPLRREASESSIDQFNAFGLDVQKNGEVFKPDSFFIEAFVS